MKLRLIPIRTENEMKSNVIMAGDSFWYPNDISNTNPSGASMTIHPSIGHFSGLEIDQAPDEGFG